MVTAVGGIATCSLPVMRIQSEFKHSHSDAHWRRCTFQCTSVKPHEEVVSMRIRLADPVLRVAHVIELSHCVRCETGRKIGELSVRAKQRSSAAKLSNEKRWLERTGQWKRQER